MTEQLSDYLGKPASILLSSTPFNLWSFVRTVDEDLPERGVNYASEPHGLSLGCDSAEHIHSIFVSLDHIDQDLLNIPISSNRADVLVSQGVPTKSGAAHSDPILGEYGAWDRFDGPSYSMHVEYYPHEDRIKMVTLMRADVVP